MVLTYPRDWTENGVDTLRIWFKGYPDNTAKPMYVVLNGSALVQHDNPDAAQIAEWDQWNIDLARFADQGVSFTDVLSFAVMRRLSIERAFSFDHRGTR